MSSLSLQREFEPYARGFPTHRKLALVVEVAGAYARARWSLSRKGLTETLARIREPIEDGLFYDATAQIYVARRISEIVLRVLEYLPADSPCLTRSVVLVDLLARRGIAPTLVIGVSPAPSFAAHAWVELEGVELLPSYGSEYSRLVEL